MSTCLCAQRLSRVRLCNPMLCSRRAPLGTGFPGKNTGVGCRFLFQGFLTQGLNLRLLQRQMDSLPLGYLGNH